MNHPLDDTWQQSQFLSNISSIPVRPPLTECSVSYDATSPSHPSIPIARSSARVITEPGCYAFPLHSASYLPFAPTAGGCASERRVSSVSRSGGTAISTLNKPLLYEPSYPISAPSTSAPYVAHPYPSSTMHPVPSLPKLLPSSYGGLPTPPASSSLSFLPSVAIPPATESEVQQYCIRKAPDTSTPPLPRPPVPYLKEMPSDTSSSCLTGRAVRHPYARIHAKRDPTHPKTRKLWNHALEKSLFTPHELESMRAPIRRKIYMASLEAYIDAGLAELHSMGRYPVSEEDLEPYYGLNSKIVKSMVSGLHKDADEDRVKLLELRRANDDLRKRLKQALNKSNSSQCHDSVDGTKYVYPDLSNSPEANTIIS